MDILNIDRPNLDELSCYIQLVLLSQGIFTEPKEVRLVCSVFQGDTRAILSHLQAQTQSLAPPIDLLSDETVSFRCAENLLGTIFVPQATIGDSVPAENDLDFTSRYLEMQSITDYTIPNAYIEVKYIEIYARNTYIYFG